MEFWQYLLTGAAGAAIIKLIDNIIQWKLARKAKQEDRADDNMTKYREDTRLWRADVEKKIQALSTAQMVSLLDRIQYLCKSYIRDGEVDFDDRHRLHQMHEAYHALGGNGDLNSLMQEVDELKLKIEK